MSTKVDAATGVVSVAVFGVSATLTPQDATAWGNVIITMAPAILILFLLWRIHKMDKQHAECNKNWAQTREQLTLAWRAIQQMNFTCKLPTEKDFLEGNFTLDESIKGEKL